MNLDDIDFEYSQVISQIMEEAQCVAMLEDEDLELEAFAQELAEGVTAERDAEIAAALPVPYTKRVNARAQIDGDTLLIPRCIIATASRVPDGDWITSTRGPRMGRVKTDCVVGMHVELDMPDVVQIIRVVILWRREK